MKNYYLCLIVPDELTITSQKTRYKRKLCYIVCSNIKVEAENSNGFRAIIHDSIVPITHQLNLKAMAKALLVKKVQMAEAKQVQSSTGYVLGGVSPIGQKNRATPT